MKKILQRTSISFMMVFMFLLSNLSALGQTAGFNTTYIVLNVNNGADTYYDLQATTANPDFSGASLGSFCADATNALIFRGGEHNVYKCGGCDLQSTRIYYRIYPVGSPSGSFISNAVNYNSGFTNGCGGEDQKWSTVTYNTNLLAGLAAGNYALEVYSDATTTCLGGTVYAGNGGANYIATFTVNANVTYYADLDGDGFGDPNVSQTTCTGVPAGYVANDDDCNDAQLYYIDDDGDGYGSDVFSACAGVTNSDDCDDTLLLYLDADGDGYGSGPFIACGVSNDDDCDDSMITYQDNDGDGFGSTTMSECGVANNTDCDDDQLNYVDSDGDGFGSDIFSACDGVTNSDDCDDNQLVYTDNDFDGFGVLPYMSCLGGSLNDDDCDDSLVIFEDNDGDGFGSEILTSCDGVTNSDDCDDSDASLNNQGGTYYQDLDGDGFGNPNVYQFVCFQPAGYVTNGTDCDDTDANGQTGTTVYYADQDGDGFGNPNTTVIACFQPNEYVLDNTDCDDEDPSITTNGGTYYGDADGDGFGNPGVTQQSCGQPAGYVLNDSDCDDTNAQVNIGTGQTFYADTDGDGFGDANSTITACTPPAGYVANNTDCDDTTILYADTDGDGFGSDTMVACNGVDDSDDCDDTNANVNPNMQEVFNNGIDDNCNGQLDEGNQTISQVVPSQCGSTLSNINTIIALNSLPMVNGYRIEVTNTTTNAVQIIERMVNYFSLTMLASYDYATTYSIRVEVRKNGIWLGYYGPACLVSTPNIVAPGGASQINPSQCGTTLTNVGTLIATSSLAGVTGYRFRVTNLTDATAPNQVQVIDRTNHYFNLPMLANYNYGTTYNVEVAMKTNGAYSAYGSACTITTPAVPSLTNCGGSVASSKTLIYTTSLANVTSYRFEVTNLTTNVVTVITRPVHYFTFDNLPGYSPSEQYGVRVALMTNGFYSPYGTTCTITSPSATTRQDAIAETLVEEFEMDAVGYPNPFADSFSISLKSASQSSVDVKVYDMTGRLMQSGTHEVSELETFTTGTTYPSGVYTVVVTQQGETDTFRIVKR